MTDMMTCPPREDLIVALYGEATPDERQRLDAHLASCETCRDDWDGLRGVRSALRAWKAPDTPVQVRLVVDSDVSIGVGAATGWRRALVGRYAVASLAAAATLVLGVAAGLANLNIRIDGSGVTVSTGRGGAAAPATVAASAPVQPPARPVPAAAASVDPAPWSEELAAMAARLDAIERMRVATPVTANSTPRAEGVTLASVHSLIDAAEARQQRDLAVRFTELMRDVETQRRTDLASIQNGFGRLEGRTTAEAVRAQQMMNYIYRVSTQQPQR